MSALSVYGWSRTRAGTWLAAGAGIILAGALLGVVAALTLPAALRAAVDRSLSLYLGSLVAGGAPVPAVDVWRAAMGLDLRLAGLAWIGGLFAFGWPLTVVVLFAEGFAQGLALSALTGAAPAGVAVAVAVPALATAALLAAIGAVALSLSGRHYRARRRDHPPATGVTYAAYGAALAAAVVGLALTGLAQAYALPALVRLLA